MLNKYFPPGESLFAYAFFDMQDANRACFNSITDFDPSKIPRRKIPKDRQEVIRLMAPFSMRCNTCGEYIYAGKKFNGRKETVQGENYYGIKIFRFYIKCPTCSAEITFKTDPRNADYTVEHGVSRNFEPWREGKEEEDSKNKDPLAHLLEEEGVEESDDEDPMKALERRTEESKREMEVMDALQDIRSRNARMDRVNVDDVLQHHLDKGKSKVSAEELERLQQEEEDEILVKKYFSRDLAEEGSSAKTMPEESSISALSSHSPDTPEDSASALPVATSISVKRARAVGDDGTEAEPDVTSLLSENARMHLLGTSTTKAPSSKKKKATSAFGIVRKKT